MTPAWDEVFGPDSRINRHHTTGPVAGFLVDDIYDATAELRSAGVEVLPEPEVDDSGNAWSTIRCSCPGGWRGDRDAAQQRPPGAGWARQ